MRKFTFILVIIFLLLVAIRIALPPVLLNYVTKQINKIPGYSVTIEDLDLSLFRGAYTIKNIKLWKTPKLAMPFFQAKSIDFSIEWHELLRGNILAKITMNNPKVNFITANSAKNEQLTISDQWVEIVKSLYPLNINRMDANDGEVSLASLQGKYPYKIYISQVEFSMENIQKSTRKDKLLSSTFDFKGNVMGGGTIVADGKFDPFNKLPTFEFETKLDALNVAKVAPFLKHYSSVDVASGKFSLYAKVVAANGIVKGEVKPFIKDLTIGSKKNTNPITAIVNGAASVAAAVLKNNEQKTIATKIVLSGNVEDPNTSILSIIGYFLRHGFIRALLPQVDNTVKIEDVIYSKSNPKSKFPSYQ